MLSLYLFVWTDPIAIRAKTGALDAHDVWVGFVVQHS